MDIFKLFGIITIDNTSANNAINETSDTAEQAESKLSIAFQKIGSAAIAVGHAMATGLAVGVTAMAALTGQALNLTGELEQNMGGSEAVFAEYAGRMQDIAGTAYENMGLSASDFLATANKMGALFQGAGFGIEESATISADAMQRAADVASIMGIDTASAMEAIAGAAKGNFTMMDNLGVAINDTTLQIYAMENGLGELETTQDKVSAAMQLFMESTAYAAGNYARENETLAGSLATAKAAFENFLTGVTSADQFADALTNAGDVILGNLLELTPRLISGLTELIGILTPQLPGILESALPGLIDGAFLLLGGLASVLPDLLSILGTQISERLPDLLQLFGDAFSMLGGIISDSLPDALQIGLDILLQVVQGLASALPTAIPEITNVVIQMCDILVQNAPLFVSAATQLISGLCSGLSSALPILLRYLPTLVRSLSTALIQAYPILIEAVLSVVSLMATELPEIISIISEILPDLLTILGDTLVTLAPILIEACISYIGILVENLPIICQALWDAAPLIIDGILMALVGFGAQLRESIIDPAIAVFMTWFEDVKLAVSEKANSFIESVVAVFEPIKEKVLSVFENIKNGVQVAIMFIGNIISFAKELIMIPWNFIWENFGDKITEVWNTITSFIEEKIAVVVGFVEECKSFLLDLMSNISGFFEEIWADVTEFISGKIEDFQTTIQNIYETVSGVFDSIKEFLTTTGSNIWENVKGTFEDVRSSIEEKLNSAKETVTSIFTDIKNAIDEKIEAAKSVVSDGIEALKGFFDFEWELPHIKLPHFSIDGSFSLNPPSAPSFGIEWYKEGGILTEPTAFGMNGNQLMVGGEAGPEAVAPIDVLQGYVAEAVASQNAGLVAVLERILDAILSMDENMGGNMREALAGTTISFDKREVARMVKAVN